jgi:two-component system response regulator (stage 0 sporulation protein F)
MLPFGEETMKKILLIDDEESIHLLYREEFEEEGYEVHSALSGEEALEKVALINPDLVILDINMPGMNGIDVLRRLKEMNSKMPVILSSAYQEFKQDLASWASDDYIVKSSNLDELKESVKRHLA